MVIAGKESVIFKKLNIETVLYIYISSIWASLVEKFLHCLNIFESGGGGEVNRLNKAKFLHLLTT